MSTWDPLKLQRMPWYAAVQLAVQSLEWPATWPTLQDYQTLLERLPQPIRTATGMPLHVVAQCETKSQDWKLGYEPRVYLQGALQTRLESWHDCFNLLTWASFPTAKAALNARQYALLAARAAAQTSAMRSPQQDVLTQFDESGVIILCADSALSEMLQRFQWKALFWEQRAAVRAQMRCLLFGHGLMEKALAPYPGLTGKGVILPVDKDFFTQSLALQLSQVDAQLAQHLANEHAWQHPQDLAPVPLMGFPEFCAANECADYYDDQRYFRPGRGAKL